VWPLFISWFKQTDNFLMFLSGLRGVWAIIYPHGNFVFDVVSFLPQYKGTFTLGVRDSSVESLNTIFVIWDLNLLIVKILC
jgi:hypothetical protein